MTTVEWRQALNATGLLRTFTEAEVIESSDVHVAQRLTELGNETDERVALAVALVVRALRGGSVCVDLTSPEMADLAAAVRVSPLLTDPPVMRVDGELL